jgi:hypothetical protein
MRIYLSTTAHIEYVSYRVLKCMLFIWCAYEELDGAVRSGLQDKIDMS